MYELSIAYFTSSGCSPSLRLAFKAPFSIIHTDNGNTEATAKNEKGKYVNECGGSERARVGDGFFRSTRLHKELSSWEKFFFVASWSCLAGQRGLLVQADIYMVRTD